MPNIDLFELSDDEIVKLVKNRWDSSSEIWETIRQVYKQNTAIYENKADWVNNLPYTRKNWAIHANRVFVNMESVINSIIANPPGINVLSARKTEASKGLAIKLENYFRKKYLDRNIKEIVRMGLRNLYFGRLIVIKPFWSPILNDFDYKALDPRKVRFSKNSKNEITSDFAIEEIEDNLCSVIDRFPEKKGELMKKYAISDDTDLYIKNPDVKYKESWIGNEYVFFTLDNIVLGKMKNPYWDWDGLLVTKDEEMQLKGEGDMQPVEGEYRRSALMDIRLEQGARVSPTKAEGYDMSDNGYRPYLFNYFNHPRKPYIFTTIFNNENTPIGRTDMITLSAELQRAIDKRKMDIDENCELVNGVIKVDSSVMGKSDAQRIRFETKGIIWGKGVVNGVMRETGAALPEMVYRDMVDSRNEIDNIMAASSAFRGEREGQETKAGRLALIQQSFLRLNELIQAVDYIYKEIFDWGMQLAKTRYTEYHYAKWEGIDNAQDTIELIQDDFEDGIEVNIIAGKTLPVDDEFKFEQAQNDFDKGALGLTDYLQIAQYENPKELAQNAVAYRLNPVVGTDMPPEKATELQPASEEKPPSVSIKYEDLPADAQIQLLAKIGIQADPEILVAEKISQKEQEKETARLRFVSKNKPEEAEEEDT